MAGGFILLGLLSYSNDTEESKLFSLYSISAGYGATLFDKTSLLKSGEMLFEAS